MWIQENPLLFKLAPVLEKLNYKFVFSSGLVLNPNKEVAFSIRSINRLELPQKFVSDFHFLIVCTCFSGLMKKVESKKKVVEVLESNGFETKWDEKEPEKVILFKKKC